MMIRKTNLQILNCPDSSSSERKWIHLTLFLPKEDEDEEEEEKEKKYNELQAKDFFFPSLSQERFGSEFYIDHDYLYRLTYHPKTLTYKQLLLYTHSGKLIHANSFPYYFIYPRNKIFITSCQERIYLSDKRSGLNIWILF